MLAAFQIHYQQHMEQLKSHDHIIKLISDTIWDLQMWPTNNAAVQQSLVILKEVKKKRTKDYVWFGAVGEADKEDAVGSN